MPTWSRPISSLFTPGSALLRHLDLGEEVHGVDVLALDLLGQAHVGVHQVDRIAHLLLVDPADAVLGVALGLHQVEPDHHVGRHHLDIDLGHALLQDLHCSLRIGHDVAPAHVGGFEEGLQHGWALLHGLFAGDDRHRVHVEAEIGPRHHHHVALAGGLLIERQAGAVVADAVHALFGDGSDLGGRLDIDPGDLGGIDTVHLGEGWEHLALAVARRRTPGPAI